MPAGVGFAALRWSRHCCVRQWVLSWELAEQLVVVDFVRSGLLGAAPQVAPALNQAPGFRTITAVIYNGLPAELKQLVGGPANATADVPIATDGNTMILTLATTPAWVAGPADETLTINYDQIFPRPFCSTGPLDYVQVRGPVTFTRNMMVTPSGNVVARYVATGTLQVTPINPITGEQGATASAQVSDQTNVLFGDRQLNVTFESSRNETRADGTGTSLFTRLQVGGHDKFTRREQCNGMNDGAALE